jgi:hypothetical protein
MVKRARHRSSRKILIALPLQTQNAEVTPLISQIHSHRQPVQIGTQLASRTRLCWARRRRLQLQLSLQFLHQLRQYFLGVSLHWTLSFRPLRSRFLLHGRIGILLQGSISLSSVIAPSECVDHGSLTRSVIGDRPSHPISQSPKTAKEKRTLVTSPVSSG